MRKETTKQITESVAVYYTRKNYVANQELSFSITKRRRVRADFIALSFKKEVVIVEVKSCVEDFLRDAKFELYMPYCHKLYVATTKEVAEKIKHLVPKGIGILVCDSKYTCHVHTNARKRQMEPERLDEVLLRFAFRNADYNSYKRHSRIAL